MSLPILTLGPPKTGKSSAIRNLNPKSTFIITLNNMDLPFAGWQKNYKTKEQVEKQGLKGKFKPNLRHCNTGKDVRKTLELINKNGKHIKVVVIDDGTYAMANDFMNRLNEDKWDKWKDLAASIYYMIQEAKYMRDDLIIIFNWHIDKDSDGNTKARTLGKLFDDKLGGVEPFFSIILYTYVDSETSDFNNKFFFRTQTIGNDVCGTPVGMFGKFLIPNDFKIVCQRAIEYANGDVEEWDEELNKELYEKVTGFSL